MDSLPANKRSRVAPVSEIPIWLDCDPGHDDAFALILAAYHPDARLLGVSTVAGNQTVDKTARNAARILLASGIEGVKVVTGQALPLVRGMRPHDPAPAPDAGIHGVSGLEGSPLLDTVDAEHLVFPEIKKAVVHMHEQITQYHETSGAKVNLVVTGSCTNVALLLTIYPEVLQHIEQISIMGGAIGFGNRSPAAEFNIMNDPEAAQIVFSCGARIVLVPLEVTHTALATDQVLARISDLNSPYSKVLRQLMTFFKDTYKKVFDFDDPPVHDPCAVAAVLRPEMFKMKLVRVDVECGSSLSIGRTVCDMADQAGNPNWGIPKRPPNVHVCIEMDVPRFWDMMLDAFSLGNERSPLNKINISKP